MDFSKRKKRMLMPQKEKYVATFFTAFLVAALLFLPYLFEGNGYFTFYGDFNVQQIPFYQKCHEAIRSGNIFWSKTTDLGANFIGSYSFYLLGSPFFWLTIPFPNSVVPYLMAPLLTLKFACAALTAYCYIRRFTRTPQAAYLGGLLYAFSGFSIYNIFFNHFHEAIVLFPLLLLSLEQLVTENRRAVFALTVALCAVCNYYFFFGMVVFTVIYFFVRMLSGAIRVRISRLFVIAFEAFAGLALSSFLLWPSVLAIAGNSRLSDILLGWSAIMYGKEQIYANIFQCFFFPPDIPARPVFFPGAEVRWSSLGGWLPLFSMTGVFVWFANKKKHWLKRVLGISILMAMVPVLNSLFSALNVSYYARWFYMPILMMCLATAVLTEENIDWSSGFRWVFGITLAISLVIGLFPWKDQKEKIRLGLFVNSQKSEYVLRYVVTCGIAICSLLAFWAIMKVTKKDRRRFFRAAIPAVCIVSVLYGNVFIFTGKQHGFDTKKTMIDQLIEGEVDLGDTDRFRVDVYDGVDNTSMYLGLQGINAFHSIVPPSIVDFYEYIGVERLVGSRPEISQAALRPLLSVKYLLNRKEGQSFLDEEGNPRMPGYRYVKTESGYYIYENENYIPFGFSYRYYMTEAFCEQYSESSRAALMLKAVLLTEEQIKKYGGLLQNIEDASYDDDELSFLLTDEEIATDSAALRETAAETFRYDNRGFTATVTREKPTLVFFSVPYEEGWTASVNGKTVPVEKVNRGFMAVRVEAGNSTIRFDYMTPGLVDGLLVTGGAAMALVVYLIVCLLLEKNKKPTEYPEGEELLKKWLAEEAADEQAREEEEKEKRPPVPDPEQEPATTEPGFDGGFKVETDLFEEEES